MSFAVSRLGVRGEGVADEPEGAVYVARALPGERVEGEIAEGRIARPRIIEAAPERRRAPCPHYNACGGCALQHASDAFVAAWKAEVVRRALEAQGLPAPIRGVATSPPASRRRAKLSGRRTRGGPLVGFHGRSSDMLTAVPGCHVLVPELRAALPALEALVDAGGTRKGEMQLTVTASRAGPDVAVSGGAPLGGRLGARLAEFAARHGLARLVWQGEIVAVAAPPVQDFGGIAVVPPPGAFLQATGHGEETLRACVAEAVGAAGRVADLFAGCGTFALPLARVAEVHAVEADAAMLAALDAGWRGAEGLRRVSVESRDLFRRPLLAAELARFDAVVIDPPRAGAAAQVAALAASGVPRIAMVSCNPASFARDARVLAAAGYRLAWVQVVDQFRWSAHVELAAAFTKPDIA